MTKQKRDTDDTGPTDGGRVLSVCLFLILLTFFILLNSIAVIDERKSRVALGSLVGAFGSFSGGLSPLKTGDSIAPPSAPMIEKKLDKAYLLSLVDEHVRLAGMIKIESEKGREIITINEKALFDKDKLKVSSYPLLNSLANLIRKGDYPVEIAGHTDNRPAEEKGYKSNWELSGLRAMQVLKHFVQRGHVSPERLTAYGCGSHKPKISNDTRQSRAQNRRINIILNFRAPAYVKRIYKKKPSTIFTYRRFTFKLF